MDGKYYEPYVNFCRPTASTCHSRTALYILYQSSSSLCWAMTGVWNEMYGKETTYNGSKFQFALLDIEYAVLLSSSSSNYHIMMVDGASTLSFLTYKSETSGDYLVLESKYTDAFSLNQKGEDFDINVVHK